MSAYKIKFRNQGPGSSSLDYTLYSAPPAVKTLTGSVQTWSNAFLTRTVPLGGTWEMAVNGAPWAYCGTSSAKPLAAGTVINTTAFRHPTLGSHGPGSTYTMYNDHGAPDFRHEESYTAPVGAYEIDAGNDFSSDMNWVAGYGLIDSNGLPRPAATFSVANNSRYAISPAPAPKFYLGGFKSTPGTLIDPDMFVSLAEIDFAQHPGQYNAIVTLDAKGAYNVEFMTQSMFAMRAAASGPATENSSVQLTQLKHQVQIMSELVDTALGISAPTNDGSTLWECSFKWAQNVGDATKKKVAGLLADSMKKRGYKLQSSSIKPDLSLMLRYPTQIDKTIVVWHWLTSWRELPSMVQLLLTDPKVVEIWFVTDTASLAETSEEALVPLPVLRPDYQCSVDWLEGPNPGTKQAITDILISSMKRQGYHTFDSTIDAKSLYLPVWHIDYPSVETVEVAWNKALDCLDPVLLRNYVTNAHVEGLVYHDETETKTAEPIVNGQAAVTIWPPPPPSYACRLTWLEGPTDPVKKSIMENLGGVMAGKGYKLFDQNPGGDKLEMFFSHLEPSDEKQALKDWTEAWNSLGFQQMYVTGPEVERLVDPAAKETTSALVFPQDPSYSCSLTWLEGPSPGVKASIMEKLRNVMIIEKGYSFIAEDAGGDKLQMKFSHTWPWSLEQALKDWTEAYNSLGFLQMYVTAPKVELLPGPAGEEGATPLVVGQDPAYACYGTWLEGPSPGTKASIMSKLAAAMLVKEYTLTSQNPGGNKLEMRFTHPRPTSLEEVSKDWTDAWHSLGSQQMYMYNPVVKPLVIPAGGDAATTTALLPPFPNFDCSLTWIENPSPSQKREISGRLVLAMFTKGYRFHSDIPEGDQLHIYFTNPSVGDLETATKDWLAARNTLGFLIMYTTNPKCDYAPVIAANGDESANSLPVMPPTYIGSLDWLEGDNLATKLSIMGKMAGFLLRRNYYPLSVNNREDGFSMFFSHDFPQDLPAATADWTAAYNSLGTQKMFVTNPRVEFAVTILSSNVPISDLNLDETVASAGETNGASKIDAPPKEEAFGTEGPAPAVNVSAQEAGGYGGGESLEEKKRRALRLLQAEGLLGPGGLSL